jgi:hypothetical protein
MTDVIGYKPSTSAGTIFTVPAGKVRYITQVQACCIDPVNAVDVTLQWQDASAAFQTYSLSHGVTVEPQDARSLLVAPFALAAGDRLRGYASAIGDADLTITYYDEDA